MATQTTDQEQYHVLDGEEQGFPLAAQTNGRHKRLMRLYLRCTAVDEETKRGICQRFRWDPGEEIPDGTDDTPSEISEDEFYAKACEIILISPSIDDPDEVVRPEVDRAIEDFEQPGGEQGGALSGSSTGGLGAFLQLLRQAGTENGAATDET